MDPPYNQNKASSFSHLLFHPCIDVEGNDLPREQGGCCKLASHSVFSVLLLAFSSCEPNQVCKVEDDYLCLGD